MLAARVFSKALGILGLIILARLLDAEDYAVVAICTFVLYFGDTISNLGSEAYIIRKSRVTDQDLNSAFTIDFVSKILIWLLTILCIPVISGVFKSYVGLDTALYASSLVILLNSLKNPGIYLLNREFKYLGIFWLQVTQKSFAFLIMLIVAFMYQSYWALIISDIVFTIIFIVGSYKISNFRPKFNTARIAIQWSYSRWVVVSGLIGYLRSQMDTLFVSKLFAPTTVGQYHLLRQVSMMPATDILAPALTPLMTSFAKVKDSKTALAYRFRLSILVSVMFVAPICLFMSVYSSLIIEVVLGSKWVSANIIMSIMSIMLFSFAVNQLISPICLVINKQKLLFLYDLVSFIFVFIALLSVFLIPSGIEQFTWVRSVAAFLPVFVFLWYLLGILGMSRISLLILVLPSICVAFITLLLFSSITKDFYDSSFLNLLINLLIYISLYSAISVGVLVLQSQFQAEAKHLLLFVLKRSESYCRRLK